MVPITIQGVTLGPWEAVGRSVFQAESVGGKEIVHRAPSRADARLIAAAPEMVQALKVLMEHHGENTGCENCKYAASVFAKAVGWNPLRERSE